MATFSFIASALQKDLPDGTNVVAAGFEVSNHSFNHLHPAELSEKQLQHEIGDAQSYFKTTLGIGPRVYWQPFAEVNGTVERLVKQYGLQLAQVTNVAVSLDFIPATTGQQIFRNATTNIKDGSIINFHEWRDETLEQMPAIIDELRKQGCVFMSLSGLLAYVKK